MSNIDFKIKKKTIPVQPTNPVLKANSIVVNSTSSSITSNSSGGSIVANGALVKSSKPPLVGGLSGVYLAPAPAALNIFPLSATNSHVIIKLFFLYSHYSSIILTYLQ